MYGRSDRHAEPCFALSAELCSLEEKGVQERREQQVADKKESRSTAAIGVDKQVNVKDVEKAERKSVPQKKATVGKEKNHLSMNGLRLIRGLFKKSREKMSWREGLIWV